MTALMKDEEGLGSGHLREIGRFRIEGRGHAEFPERRIEAGVGAKLKLGKRKCHLNGGEAIRHVGDGPVFLEPGEHRPALAPRRVTAEGHRLIIDLLEVRTEGRF